jgi:hypothetical protein
LVIPAISDGSGLPRWIWASWKKFQHLKLLADCGCSGKTAMKPLASASSSNRVSCRMTSGLCVHPWSTTTSGTAVPALYVDGT